MPEILPSHGEQIFVVEDDEEMRTLAVALLVDLGYATMAAETAPAALDILQHTGTIDLVLSDVVLPGAVNGPELAIEIQHRTPQIKIVFMTGYAEEAFKSHSDLSALSPAIHHVIHKLFKRSDFAYAISQALDEEQQPS